jgi:hypothetical protein
MKSVFRTIVQVLTRPFRFLASHIEGRVYRTVPDIDILATGIAVNFKGIDADEVTLQTANGLRARVPATRQRPLLVAWEQFEGEPDALSARTAQDIGFVVIRATKLNTQVLEHTAYFGD